jgi:hypothetical protein
MVTLALKVSQKTFGQSCSKKLSFSNFQLVLKPRRVAFPNARCSYFEYKSSLLASSKFATVVQPEEGFCSQYHRGKTAVKIAAARCKVAKNLVLSGTRVCS